MGLHLPGVFEVGTHDLSDEGAELELWIPHAVHLDIFDEDAEEDHGDLLALPRVALVLAPVGELAEVGAEL